MGENGTTPLSAVFPIWPHFSGERCSYLFTEKSNLIYAGDMNKYILTYQNILEYLLIKILSTIIKTDMDQRGFHRDNSILPCLVH